MAGRKDCGILGLLDPALARAKNIFSYEGAADIARLAAAYVFGIAKHRPFVDGNKRAAFLAAALFLRLNGRRLVADQAEATFVMLDLASSAIDEATFAAWLDRNAAQV